MSSNPTILPLLQRIIILPYKTYDRRLRADLRVVKNGHDMRWSLASAWGGHLAIEDGMISLITRRQALKPDGLEKTQNPTQNNI
ncbi:hypothetical protein BgiMline_001015 [Biomphalaria glabrata]|nr:hypothetical protein BgiMline_000941 [Biomphalaria glabrata]KAI8789150.1 hypothetical protein BgiBS90_009408 [Biomphalaria glabrata]